MENTSAELKKIEKKLSSILLATKSFPDKLEAVGESRMSFDREKDCTCLRLRLHYFIPKFPITCIVRKYSTYYELSIELITEDDIMKNVKKMIPTVFVESIFQIHLNGTYKKMIQLPADIKVNKLVVNDFKVVKQYAADFTETDIVLLSKALNMMSVRIEEYNKYGQDITI
jgi:hypothetical protein